jgi:hypothetical protein
VAVACALAIVAGTVFWLGTAHTGAPAQAAVGTAAQSVGPSIESGTATPTATRLPAPPTLAPTPLSGVRHVGDYVEFADGTYAIGGDIPPGTYVTQNAWSTCFWEVTEQTSPGVTESWDYYPGFGRHHAVIDGKYDTFSSVDCGTWTNKPE